MFFPAAGALFVCTLPPAHRALAQEEADKRAGATSSRILEIDQGSSRSSPVIPTPRETYWDVPPSIIHDIASRAK
jgi:hypothetical protein